MLLKFIWQLQARKLMSTNLPFTFLTLLILFNKRIVGILRFQIGSLPLTYLGIPIAVSRKP